MNSDKPVCPKCHSPISPQARFCDVCGVRSETRMLPTKPVLAKTENPWGLRLLVLGGILLLAAALLVAFQDGESESSTEKPSGETSTPPSTNEVVVAPMDQLPQPMPVESEMGVPSPSPQPPTPKTATPAPAEPLAGSTDVETLDIAKWEKKTCEAYLTDAAQVIPMKIFEFARTMDPISDSDEMEIGKSILQQQGDLFTQSNDAQATRYIQRLGALVAQKSTRSGIRYSFELVDRDECNAFAGPGARITVFEGMLTCVENEAQLVNVLAHEVAHIDRRHIGSVLQAIRRIHQIKLPIPVPREDREMILFFGRLSYSQEAELEADRLALKWSMELGYSPAQPIAFWENMAKREAAPNPGDPDSEFENLWRSHPQSKRRACQLRNEAVQRNQPSTQKIWYIGKQNLLQRISMQEKHF